MSEREEQHDGRRGDASWESRKLEARSWTFAGGPLTGEFEGATGSGGFSGSNRILLQRTPEGCVGPPVRLVQVFTFTGDVALAA